MKKRSLTSQIAILLYRLTEVLRQRREAINRAAAYCQTMPTPREGESKDDFVQRCMGDAEARRDFPNPSQRFAFCNSTYDQARGTASKNEAPKKRFFVNMLEDEPVVEVK